MTAHGGGFLSSGDHALGERLIRDGYVIGDVENPEGLAAIRESVVAAATDFLGVEAPDDAGDFLNHVDQRVAPSDINDFRLSIIRRINADASLRPDYFSLARRSLETLVGNELAMQRNVNLSIQMPNDPSSVLPLHADVWSGDSPFEVVLWLPLVDCFATKAMFLLSPEKNTEMTERFREFEGQPVETLYKAIEPDLRFIDIRYGQFLLFNQNLMHGNRVNVETETRWSMNCRFKSLFSPYAEKRLGEFFEPITLRAATRIGLEYEWPRLADD